MDEITTTVVWVAQNPDAILPLVGFMLLLAFASLGLLLLGPDS